MEWEKGEGGNISELQPENEGKHISFKAIVFSLIVITLLSVFIQYAELTQKVNSIDTAMMPSMAGMLGIFLAVAVGAIYRKVKFKSEELAVVYVMVTVGGLFASLGLVGFSVGNIGSLSALALDIPEFYQPILDRFSSLVVVKGEDEALAFLLGGADRVPWEKWILPLIVWTVFWSVLFFFFLCIVTLVRRHWVTQERLTFPLVQPPLAVIREISGDGAGSLFCDRLFLLGMILPILYSGLLILRGYFPVIPAPPEFIDLSPYFTEPPLDAINEWPPLRIFVNPLVIGIGYLISLELSFSLWFFYLLVNKVYAVILKAVTGTTIYLNIRYDMGRGIFMAISVFLLWIVRNNIKNVFFHAFTKRGSSDDSDEPLPYRVAAWGLVGSIIFVCLFCVFMLNMSWVGFVPFLIIFILTGIGFARLRAEAGYPFSQPHMEFTGVWLIRGLGQDLLGDINTYSMSVMFKPMETGYFGSVPALALEAYQIGDAVGIKRRCMTKAVVIAFLVAIVVGYIAALPIIYEHGLYNLSTHHRVHALDSYAHRNIVPEHLYVWTSYGIGIILGVFMMIMRTAFVWWPFHPLGLAIASNSWMANFWSSFFIAWLAKWLIQRYGGYGTVRKVRPFFLGLILGQVGISTLGAVIGIIVNLVS